MADPWGLAGQLALVVKPREMPLPPLPLLAARVLGATGYGEDCYRCRVECGVELVCCRVCIVGCKGSHYLQLLTDGWLL